MVSENNYTLISVIFAKKFDLTTMGQLPGVDLPELTDPSRPPRRV